MIGSRRRWLTAALFMLCSSLALASAGGASGATAASASASTSSDTKTIVAVGDIACDPVNGSFNGGDGTATHCQQKWTAQTAEAVDPDAVLPLGDLVYDCGGPREYAGGYAPFWGPLDPISHPVIGNHEYQASSSDDRDCTPDGSGYFDYFGAAAGDPSRGYYSWNLGSWHMVALNGNCSVVSCAAGSPQLAWLTQDLAASSQPCILAYWHEPLFTSRGDPSASTRPFWNALYAAGADVVLNGHIHVYERFAKMDPSGSPDADGMREFIVGTGGNDHGSLASSPVATDQAHNADTFGVLEMSLGADGYSWQFLPDGHSGSFTDSGSDTCNGPAPAPAAAPRLAGMGPLAVGDTGPLAADFSGTARGTYTIRVDGPSYHWRTSYDYEGLTAHASWKLAPLPTAGSYQVAILAPGGAQVASSSFTVTGSDEAALIAPTRDLAVTAPYRGSFRVRWTSVSDLVASYAVALYRGGSPSRVLCSYPGRALAGTTTTCSAAVPAGSYQVRVVDQTSGSTIGTGPSLRVRQRLSLLPTRLSRRLLRSSRARLGISFGASIRARLAVVVEHRDGRPLRRLRAGTLARGRHSLSWDGRNRFGRPVAPGRYRLRVVARSPGQEARGRWFSFSVR